MKQHFYHHLWRWCFGLFISGLLVGCSDEEQLFDVASGDSELLMELQASIDQINRSRADDSGFADGDRFGVFVVNYQDNLPGKLTASGNQVNNVAFSYIADANKWRAATDIYWRDAETSADVYGYYPYNSGVGNVNSHQFEVKYDQSNVSSDGEMSNYEASDFLWAKKSGAKPGQRVELTFRHIMAGVAVTLEKGSGFEEGAWEQLSKLVTVDNTIRTANIDLSTGIATPSGPFDRHVEMCQEPGGTYRAVVVPQSVTAGKSIIGITIDGVAYNFIREGGMIYTSGKLHNFTIRIDKKESGDYQITLISQEITPWENDQLTHNFFEYEYTTVTVSEPGTLKSAIVALGKDFSKIKSLKIIGPLDNEDFRFMREEMSELAMLNMKEALCKDIIIERWEEVSPGLTQPVPYHVANAIPNSAFEGKKSLRRIIFSDDIEYIGVNAFGGIGLDVNSSIVLPKNLKHIENGAFAYIEEAGELVLNDKLEYIGDNVFTPHFHCDFNLPPTLKHIGSHAFGGNGGQLVNGNFRLPDKLEYIGEGAFNGVEYDGVGDLIVPDFMTELIPIYPAFKRGVTITFHDNISKIKHIALYDKRFINKVIIPDKVTHIEESAFSFSVFSAGLSLPSSLRELGSRSFMGARGLGDLEIPNGVEVIPGSCFGGTDLNSVVLPNSILSIEDGAFACDVRSVTIGKNCGFFGKRAFSAPQMQTLICLNPEPPILDGVATGESPFEGCNMDHLILQVPEESVDLYRNTEGWNRIRFITAYHELSVGVSEIQCLDKGMEYNTLLRSEGAWEVASCPDWVTVTPATSSDLIRRNEISIKVAPTSVGTSREGVVVFKLKDKDYTTSVNIRQYAYDKGEDTEINLHKATAGGDEIPVLFVGEGFTASDIVDGTYNRMIEEAYADYFAIEPFKSYKDYFTASTAIAVSPDRGISRNVMEINKFNFHDEEGALDVDFNKVRSYAASINPIYNSSKALVVVVPNYDSFIGKVDHSDTAADVALCGYSHDTYPYDFRGTIQHFAGGLAFGKLAPEYISHYDFIRGCKCPSCNGLSEYNAGVAKGWYGNLSLTGAINTLPWRHYIYDPKYSDIVDVYEGGYRHLRGIFRSENQSCMSTYIQYFNTISRELIVRRIMSLSNNIFNLDDFIARDSREGCPQ